MNYISYYQSPIGLLEIMANERAIFSLTVVTEKEKNIKENNITKKCIDEIKEYFSGKRKEFTIPVEFIGTKFQVAIWTEAMKVSYAETASYKDLAVRTGYDKAARAVGNAMNKNPILIIMPCHRIVGSNGGLKGFKYGMGTRKKLLLMETKMI